MYRFSLIILVVLSIVVLFYDLVGNSACTLLVWEQGHVPLLQMVRQASAC